MKHKHWLELISNEFSSEGREEINKKKCLGPFLDYHAVQLNRRPNQTFGEWGGEKKSEKVGKNGLTDQG